MSTFVRVKDYPEWFMLLDGNTDDSVFSSLSEKLSDRMRTSLWNQHLKSEKKLLLVDKLKYMNDANLDYKRFVGQYGPILVREIGSWMMAIGKEIVEVVEAEHFPVDDYGDIIICENDATAEPEWVKYLEANFKGKTIKTIPYFKTQSVEYIRAIFEEAEIVTFSTTFYSMEWFEKMTKCLNAEHRVVGYTHCPEKWEEAKKICPRVEIVENL